MPIHERNNIVYSLQENYNIIIPSTHNETAHDFIWGTHPKLDKIWIGNKSTKLSIIEKLNEINKIVDDLEKDIYPVKTT